MERKKTRTVVHVTGKENGATGDKEEGTGDTTRRAEEGSVGGDQQKQSLYENSMTPI